MTIALCAIAGGIIYKNTKGKFTCPCHESSISKCQSPEVKSKIDKLHKKLSSSRDTLQRGETAQQISKLYVTQGLFEQSLYYLYVAREEYILLLKDAKKGLSKLTDQEILQAKSQLANVLFSFGDIYKYMGNTKQALNYHKRAYKIRLKNKSTSYNDLLLSQYAIKDINIRQMTR